MSCFGRDRRVRQFLINLSNAALMVIAALAWTSTVLGVGLDQIPDPRPTGWSTDLTSRIPQDTVKALNRLGNQVRQQMGAHLVIVVIGSTDGADPHRFATDLFNRWQIGEANKNNGVLVFAALNDRKAEIILGDGVSNEPRVQASRKIMQEVILPKFKAGDPGGAVFGGARACAEQILGVSLEPLQAEVPAADDQPSTPTPTAPANPQAAPPVMPPAVARPVVAVNRPNTTGNVFAWCFGGLGGFAAALFGARKYMRCRTRWCAGCGGRMTRLGESADDQYLTQGERTEERLGSVDYDVWACGGCGKTKKFRHGAFFTRYSRCPQCRAKTKSTVKRTIRAASYTQGGLIEVEDLCHNCSYRNTRTHSTPILTDNTVASSTLWSAGASSASTSFNAGSSGGHSSGAGASGGW